jgi:AAA+ superfamily predicted ATPase
MGTGLTTKISSYLNSLPETGYGISRPLASAFNYLIDSYFAKIDERIESSRLKSKPMPGDFDTHIKELWLGCEIHLCSNLSRSYPAYAKSLNAWAFSRLFSHYVPESPYDIIPFIDTYEYKEYVKSGQQFRIQSESIEISLNQSVSLPVSGTFFVQHRVTGCRFIMRFDFCYYDSNCSIQIMSRPEDLVEAERFFQDYQTSLRENDIYFQKCLMFNKGNLGFFGIIPTSWNDIILKDDIKLQIRNNSVGILQNMESLASVGMCPNRNVMLISPPGMAKTTIFRATSNEVNGQATRIWCTGKSIVYPDHVTALFEAARGLAPCLIFIEDMDLFGGERTTAGRDSSVLNEFLAQLDGAQSNSGIVVMASTNDLESMDEALVARPGRFSVKVEIPYPDADDRSLMLQAFLTALNVKCDASMTRESVKTVIDLCAGFTGDYIKKLAESAVIKSAAAGRVQNGQAVVTADDLTTAAEQEIRNYKIGKRARQHHSKYTSDLEQPNS